MPVRNWPRLRGRNNTGTYFDMLRHRYSGLNLAVVVLVFVMCGSCVLLVFNHRRVLVHGPATLEGASEPLASPARGVTARKRYPFFIQGMRDYSTLMNLSGGRSSQYFLMAALSSSRVPVIMWTASNFPVASRT